MKYKVEFILQSNVFSSKEATGNSLLCLEYWGREGSTTHLFLWGWGGAFSKLLVYPSRGNFVRMLDPEVSYGAEIAM